MTRVLSHLLILWGLALAGFGFNTIFESRHAESEAQAEWDREVAAQSAKSLPSRQRSSSRNFKKGALVARLSIQRLKRNWIIVEGAGKSELRRGPGHLIETALPGADGNCVIAGHRDTQFRILRDVKLGETIMLESGGRRFIYRVITRATISPTDTTSLRPTPIPMLTLITCYPFYYVGPAPKRFVVRAKLVSWSGPQA